MLIVSLDTFGSVSPGAQLCKQSILMLTFSFLDSAHPTYVVHKAVGEAISQQLTEASKC